MGKACCGKAAEGHGCGCGTMNAEEPVVQEPDWIPAGDGRAIGQQDFAINLSPLHAEGFGADDYTDEQLLKVARRDIDNHIDNGTFYVLGDEPQAFHDGELDGENFYTILSLYSQHHEDEDKAEMILTDMFKKEYPQYLGDESFNAESRFDKLSNEIADEYEEKGMSPEKAQEVGDATAAMIGRKKYGKKGMMRMQRKGMRADMVGSPSPTFNEDIMGQDGPSSTPTNASFAAFEGYGDRHDPVKYANDDVKNFRKMVERQFGLTNIEWDAYLYSDVPSKTTGRPANKGYYLVIYEKGGRYYPIAGHGGAKTSRWNLKASYANLVGGKEGEMASVGSKMEAWKYVQNQMQKKRRGKSKYRDLPFNLSAESKGAETLAQIEGPTAEATSGGLHSPSSFTIGWEDGAGYSSASMPPNEIAWAENVKGGEGMGKNLLTYGAIGVLVYGAYSIFKGNKVFNAVNARNNDCGCGSKVQRTETVKKHSEYSVGQINPVEVEGQNDIYNAESIRLPQPHAGPQTSHIQNPRRNLKMW